MNDNSVKSDVGSLIDNGTMKFGKCELCSSRDNWLMDSKDLTEHGEVRHLCMTCIASIRFVGYKRTCVHRMKWIRLLGLFGRKLVSNIDARIRSK